MTRAERSAKLSRDLKQLRSRLLRIQGEVFQAVREIGEIEGELAALTAQGEDRP